MPKLLSESSFDQEFSDLQQQNQHKAFFHKTWFDSLSAGQFQPHSGFETQYRRILLACEY